MLAELVQKGGLAHSCSRSQSVQQAVAEVATVAVAEPVSEQVTAAEGWRDVVGRLPLLREDGLFVEEQMKRVVSVPKRLQLAEKYRTHWQQAAGEQSISYRKENSGRFAANSFLRQEVDHADTVH